MPLPGNRIDGPALIRAAETKAAAEGRRLVYFAHSLLDYGLVPEEVRAAIAAQFPPAEWNVLDPEEWGGQDIIAAWGSYDAFYRDAVRPCAAVAVLEHQGHVGRGVASEIAMAREQGRKPVRVVRRRDGGGWEWGDVLRVIPVDPNDWKLRFARLAAVGPIVVERSAAAAAPPGGAPRAWPTPPHRCHAAGCKIAVPPKMLMCARHWRMVPPNLKSEVWRTYQPGQEQRRVAVTAEYLAAADAAIRAVAAKEGRLAAPREPEGSPDAR